MEMLGKVKLKESLLAVRLQLTYLGDQNENGEWVHLVPVGLLCSLKKQKHVCLTFVNTLIEKKSIMLDSWNKLAPRMIKTQLKHPFASFQFS